MDSASRNSLMGDAEGRRLVCLRGDGGGGVRIDSSPLQMFLQQLEESLNTQTIRVASLAKVGI